MLFATVYCKFRVKLATMENVVFLDRDGVINKNIDNGYVTSWAKFEFLPGIFEALSLLYQEGFNVIIISNQAGISKRLFTAEALALVTQKMLAMIEENGGKIFSVHYCSHADEDECICRKPKTGLFKQAIAGKSVDCKKAFVIGDSERDVIAGKSMDCKTIIVLCGKTRSAEEVRGFKARPDYIADDLLDAVKRIILKEGS